METPPPLTQLPFEESDFKPAERMAKRLGFSQWAYTTSSALWGLFCLPDYQGQRKGCIVKTAEFGFLFVQCQSDIL